MEQPARGRRNVVGLLPGTLPNAGAVAVGRTDDVSLAFGRGTGSDYVLVKRAHGVQGPELNRRLTRLVGGTATVGSVSQVTSANRDAFKIVRTLLILVAAMCALVAAAVLVVAWRLQVLAERVSIAQLRLNGARPRHLFGGLAVLFLGAFLLCCLVGVPLAVLGAHLLHGRVAQLATITGLAAVPSGASWRVAALAGVAGGLAIAVTVGAITAWQLVSIPTIDAIREATVAPSRVRTPWRRALFACGLALVGAWAGAVFPNRVSGVAIVLLVASALLLSGAVPALAGRLLGERSSGLGMLVGRAYQRGARDLAPTIALFAVATMLAIALSGLVVSVQGGIQSSVHAWSGGQLFVEPTSPANILRDEQFGPNAVSTLRRLPAVAGVSPFRQTQIIYGGRLTNLSAWDPSHVRGFVDLHVREGLRSDQLWSVLARGDVAVSTSFASLHHVSLGDVISVPAAGASRRRPIRAIVDDALSPGGTIYASLATSQATTGSDRLTAMGVNLRKGGSEPDAIQAISHALRAYPGTVVWTDARPLVLLQARCSVAVGVAASRDRVRGLGDLHRRRHHRRGHDGASAVVRRDAAHGCVAIARTFTGPRRGSRLWPGGLGHRPSARTGGDSYPAPVHRVGRRLPAADGRAVRSVRDRTGRGRRGLAAGGMGNDAAGVRTTRAGGVALRCLTRSCMNRRSALPRRTACNSSTAESRSWMRGRTSSGTPTK